MADLLLEESHEEGIIPALLERNRQIKCLLGYQDEKQTDRVIREEVSKASALQKVRN